MMICVSIFLILMFCRDMYCQRADQYQSKCVDNLNCHGFVCSNGICSECTDTTSCDDHTLKCRSDEFHIISNGTHVKRPLRRCEFKSLFFPFTWQEGLATFLIVIGGALSASSGIGGAGLYIPLFKLVAGYDYDWAISLASVSIVGSSISNVFLLLFQKHPTLKRPMIDFNFALVNEPVVLAGTILGVILNVVFPDWLLSLVLVGVISIGAMRSCTHGCRGYRKAYGQQHDQQNVNDMNNRDDHSSDRVPLLSNLQNNNELNEMNSVSQSNDDESENLSSEVDENERQMIQQIEETRKRDDETLVTFGKTEEDDVLKSEEISDKEDEFLSKKEVVRIRNSEKSRLLYWIVCFDSLRLPIPQIICLFVIWILVLFVSLFKGSSKHHSIVGVKYCSTEFFLLSFLSVPFFISVSCVIGSICYGYEKVKVRNGYEYEENETKWNVGTSFLMPFLFLCIGVFAGMVGKGGGLMIVPLLLEIGVNSEVASATSAFMVLLTASATLVQFVVLGRLTWDYSLWYGGWTLAAGFVGRILIAVVVKRSKGSYIVTFVIALTLAICAFLMLLVAIKLLVVGFVIKDYDSLAFHSLCQS